MFHRLFRRVAFAALLSLSCVPVAPAVAAVRIEHLTADLSPSERETAHRIADDVLARLPAAWREALPARVDVEWRDDLPPQVHGRALGNRVLIRRDLLDGEVGNASPHPAAVALVHELAHVYDRSAAGALSRDARLLDLAGWQRTPVGGRARRNTFTDRAADRYELTHPREFVAVNFERFVFDDEFACRRPALYRHLATRLGASPSATPCPATQPFLLADTEPGADASPLLEINPAHVAGIDYLLAEPTSAVMSRWGHGMLRLIVCAPHRPPGPDCRLDLEHHRVLSFRAFVDDVQISSWRGLTGSYPSRLFVLPMSQVIDEYTKGELRGLQSVPLRLSRDDIAGVLERAAQMHWSYDGRYYFVTNNCAVETWRLLRDGAPGLSRSERASLTPTGLLRRLMDRGIADVVPLRDSTNAARLGYYFESQRTQYAAMFDVARSTLDLPGGDVEGWLDLAPERRASWIMQADLRAAAAMLVLEGAALRREEHRAREELKRRLLSTTSDAGQQREQALAALRLVDRLTRPAALAPAGYGIPQARERAVLAEAAGALARQWRDANARLRSDARQSLPPARRARLVGTEQNLARLGERLRELHHVGPGLKLDAAVL